MEISKSTALTYGKKECGVPQCTTYKQPGISMHSIPKTVLNSKVLKNKWKIAIKMGKEFPNHFKIYSNHFANDAILTSIVRREGAQKGITLKKNASPSKNLPVSSINIQKPENDSRSKRLETRNVAINSESCDDYIEIEPFLGNEMEEEVTTISTAIQCQPKVANKQTQIHLVMPVYITSLWDTDGKLFTKTGIPTMMILEKMVEVCQILDNKSAQGNMTLRNKILMTMHLIKSNCFFADLMIDFQLSYKSVKLYFTETIQLLSEAMKGLIHWQSKEENLNSLPKCFKHFRNVMTVLDCTETKIATFRCLKCRTSSYSHYKSAHTVKCLIGVAPSGMINFVSPVVGGKSSDKAIFKLTNLLEKVKPGDAVMVDKGFLIGSELSNAGIEMVRPEFLFNTISKEDVEKNTEIAAARVHVERRFAKLKRFKVLSEKPHHSLLPYFDDIITVICALSNLSAPILNDDKFL